MLSKYSYEIVQFVCDPFTGLPGQLKWMPSVAEVKAACNARADELAKIRRYQNWGKPLAASDKPAGETDAARKPTLEQLKAKYGPNWGIDVKD